MLGETMTDQTTPDNARPNDGAGAWRPIASAPRDADVWVYGLAIIWANSCPFLWQGQAGWDEDGAIWLTTAHDDKGSPLKVIPTHWMPLPAPPKRPS